MLLLQGMDVTEVGLLLILNILTRIMTTVRMKLLLALGIKALNQNLLVDLVAVSTNVVSANKLIIASKLLLQQLVVKLT